jgi:hypothetical protein
MIKIPALLLILLSIFTPSFSQETISSSEILQYCENNFPHSGILKFTEDFLYVDLDDAYIHELTPFIQEEGFEEPPYFGDHLVGAHISVIYPKEIKQHGFTKFDEVGQTINFSIKECKIVKPHEWRGVDAIYVIVVDALKLKEIRKKYGLPEGDLGFHITIGVKYKSSFEPSDLIDRKILNASQNCESSL